MRFIIFISLIFFLSNCSKPKTVLICGDHVCLNKAEAEQYFEENLSIEVKVINKQFDDEEDLVELNLKENSLGKKRISISSKNTTNKSIRALSNKEVTEIKKNLRNKKKEKKIDKKEIINKKKLINIKEKKKEKLLLKKKTIINKDVNKKRNDIVDVCTILEKCSIDEISKYLLEQGKNKKFPDITTRQ